MIKLYTTTEVAQATGLTDRSVRRRIQNGTVQAVTVRRTDSNRTIYGVTEKGLNTLKTVK
jgi:hypothetical protein